jgi:hypothetical protein
MFSDVYLNKFLEHPIEVVVNCNRSEKEKYVRLRMGEYGSAMMTSGWKEVVEEFKLKKGEICIFSFKVQSGAWF